MFINVQALVIALFGLLKASILSKLYNYEHSAYFLSNKLENLIWKFK